MHMSVVTYTPLGKLDEEPYDTKKIEVSEISYELVNKCKTYSYKDEGYLVNISASDY